METVFWAKVGATLLGRATRARPLKPALVGLAAAGATGQDTREAVKAAICLCYARRSEKAKVNCFQSLERGRLNGRLATYLLELQSHVNYKYNSLIENVTVIASRTGRAPRLSANDST